jgi:NTE family protein
MKKIGICLSGGGARGAYQIGALKALEELGILQKANGFSGASIGAANAIFVATGAMDAAKEIWFNVPENPLGDNPSIVNTLRDQKLKVIDSGLFSIKKLNQLLDENIDFELLKNQDVFIAIADTGDSDKGIIDLFKSTFTHYIQKDSQVQYIPLKELNKDLQIDTIVASCSIPIVFPPVVTNSRKYRDGGYFDNTPIKPLIDFGCDEIICITISMLSSIRSIKQKYKNVKIHEIKASRRLGNVLDFSSEHSKRIYEYGYRDAMKYFAKMSLEEFNLG